MPAAAPWWGWAFHIEDAGYLSHSEALALQSPHAVVHPPRGNGLAIAVKEAQGAPDEDDLGPGMAGGWGLFEGFDSLDEPLKWC